MKPRPTCEAGLIAHEGKTGVIEYLAVSLLSPFYEQNEKKKKVGTDFQIC